MSTLLSLGNAKEAPLATPEIKAWLTELSDAMKREKEWRKDGDRLTTVYECGKAKEYQFNILYSNTETLAPALYNNLPRPVVQRRFKDEDPLGKMSGEVAQRVLEFLLDNDVGAYTPFDDLAPQAVLEALVPGRGVVRFRYDAEFTKTSRGEENPENEDEQSEPSEEVSYETVYGEFVPWNRFLHGYAKQWKDVPWVAFEHFFSKEEMEKNFGELGAKVPLTVSDKAESNSTDDESDSASLDDTSGVKLAHVYEIWDRDTKKVLFLAPAFPSQYLRNLDDPLGLSRFFPMARPLTFFAKIKSLVPVPLYAAYEEQAKELNRITVRINKIIQALKVRGFYDSTLEGLDRVLQADDNTLIPAENVAAMQQGQSLEKSIWLMPLQELVVVLQQLYAQRQQVKQVIYEITGISDILRGASMASETATAQNIKNQWGTLRLKRMQKIVGRFVRDSLRVMVEIAVTKLSTKTIASMTGLPYPTAEQKAQAQQLLIQLQSQSAPGTPPPPQAQQLMEIVQKPSWDDLMRLLRDDLQRNYRIDIETNSTVDAEATDDKQDMGEFLNAVAQFMNGVAPMVQSGTLPFDAAKAILLAVTRRYRFGPEVEDELKKMTAPPPPAAGGEGDNGAAQAAGEKAKLDLEIAKLDAQLKSQSAQLDFQLKQAEHAMKMQELQQQQEFSQANHQIKLQGLALQAMRDKAKATQPAKPASITQK